jgi:prevent-host-death family protein
MSTTLETVTEIPEEELVARLDEVFARVQAGEVITITRTGKPAVYVTQRRRPSSVSWDEFLRWPKADPKMLDDIRSIIGDETTDDVEDDPWVRFGEAR